MKIDRTLPLLLTAQLRAHRMLEPHCSLLLLNEFLRAETNPTSFPSLRTSVQLLCFLIAQSCSRVGLLAVVSYPARGRARSAQSPAASPSWIAPYGLTEKIQSHGYSSPPHGGSGPRLSSDLNCTFLHQGNHLLRGHNKGVFSLPKRESKACQGILLLPSTLV